jgi:NAD(P)-dependent dehydrogenase (short-subunit alcohol dehydrogenase family)
MELNDLRVLVTGATAGIGRETAKLFARRGATVVVTGRNDERGEQTVAAIVAEGGQAAFLAADMNDVESVRQLADQVGDVDVLVNNAAVFPFAPTLLQDIESFEMMFDVNVRASFFLTAALLPKMIARGYGAIVNVSTAAASASLAEAPVYAATKAALESLTRSWAAALGPNGIRVNAVAPGPSHTDMANAMLGDGVEKMGAQTPLGRTAKPAEIAEASVFLASPQASYVTGAIVAVDGGYGTR